MNPNAEGGRRKAESGRPEVGSRRSEVGESVTPPTSELRSPTSDSEVSRYRKAFLAAKRGELLTPIHAVVDTSERLLSQIRQQHIPEISENPRDVFLADVKVIHQTAQELLEMIDEVLHPERIDSASTEEDFRRMQSQVRHDMLNKLNPIINYSELWLEDADEPTVRPFEADLRMICESGKQCLSLIDRILTSFNEEVIDLTDSSMKLVTGAVEEIFKPADDSGAAGETGRLLVVDDNATNRVILDRRLKSQGHDVYLAKNGTEALEMLADNDFDLVLLDILMPQVNGFDVLVRMKSSEAMRDIPVIMISALSEMDVVVRCIEAGAEDYLPKPFNPVMLKARIGACLEKKRLREREKEHLRQIEREQHRADELLHVILPTDIVAELKRDNRVKPRRYENVAVLFADIVNFTPFCDRTPPEEVMSVLQRLVVAWEESALRHNVDKIKTIGDAFMAASGLLNHRGDPVLNCLRCGVEMIEATRQLASEWSLRIGIHRGSVVGGVLGRRQYLFDLWGDTVNTAARMESHGVPGQITLSEAAWRTVEAQCHGSRVQKVPIKGKGPMDIFRFDGFVEGFAPAATDAPGLTQSVTGKPQ
jgi:adenylate cyclase